MNRKTILVILIGLMCLSPIVFAYGPFGHKWATQKAFNYLPSLMNAFCNKFESNVVKGSFLVEPDWPGNPSHGNDEALGTFSQEHYDKVVSALKNRDWNKAEEEMEWMVHYIADACSPTQVDTRTHGTIDDFYDVLVDLNINHIAIQPQPTATLINDIKVYVKNRCAESRNLYADALIDIYNNYHTNTATAWLHSSAIFSERLNQAVTDIRDILYTAWDKAGRPTDFGGGGNTGCARILSYAEGKH